MFLFLIALKPKPPKFVCDMWTPRRHRKNIGNHRHAIYSIRLFQIPTFPFSLEFCPSFMKLQYLVSCGGRRKKALQTGSSGPRVREIGLTGLAHFKLSR